MLVTIVKRSGPIQKKKNRIENCIGLGNKLWRVYFNNNVIIYKKKN